MAAVMGASLVTLFNRPAAGHRSSLRPPAGRGGQPPYPPSGEHPHALNRAWGSEHPPPPSVVGQSGPPSIEAEKNPAAGAKAAGLQVRLDRDVDIAQRQGQLIIDRRFVKHVRRHGLA